MEKQLNQMIGELYDLKNLLCTLNQAHKYCYNNDIDTYHLHTLIEYSISTLNDLITNFQNIEVEYFLKHRL
uniref:hypothetical protein n=1 Tax=Candidatus Scatousia sp. TaxID=3085663 RepID=UPI0040252CF4